MQFITIKIFFFLLDFITLNIYLKHINRNCTNNSIDKILVYYVLTLIFGYMCMLTSCINIISIYLSTITKETSNLYLCFRFYIYIIEWLQYLFFLRTLKSGKIKSLIMIIFASTIIIHLHYIFIEYIEVDLINVDQYISPFDLIWCNLKNYQII